MIIRLGERDLRTRYGTFREILYYDGQRESIALVMGDVDGVADVLCRIHSACVGGHVFNSVECECAAEMAAAQAAIQKAGCGVIVYLDQEGKGNGHLALIESIKYKQELGQGEAYIKAGFTADARDYRPAAEIIRDLGVESVDLISGSTKKATELERYSIKVSSLSLRQLQKIS
jgi:GTP cyclohydrolase II